MKFARSSLVILALILSSFCSPGPKGFIILCAGDSITAGDYPRFLQRIIKKEGISVKVLNYGRSGNTSGEYLRYLQENSADLAEEHPHYICLQLGTNDVRQDGDKTSAAKFADNMKKILRIFRRFHTSSGKETQVLLATIPPIPKGSIYPFSADSRNRVVSEINPVIRRLAGEKGLILVDNYALFRNAPNLLPGIHPSEEGYRELARNWHRNLKALMK